MQLIESKSNTRLKRARRVLAGREKQYFLVEGKKLLGEAIDSGVTVDQILASPEFYKRERELLDRSGAAAVDIVTHSLLNSLSDVETSQGVVAIAVRSPEPVVEQVLKTYAALLYAVRDPGNLGTILRGAEAAGCEFLALTPDCADPYQPKAVRASMGSVFRIRLFQVSDAVSYLKKTRSEGTHLYGMFPSGGRNLFEMKPSYPALLVVGSESKGLPEELPLDTRLSIPMEGKVESINVAMAAVIGFYYFLKKAT